MILNNNQFVGYEKIVLNININIS